MLSASGWGPVRMVLHSALSALCQSVLAERRDPVWTRHVMVRKLRSSLIEIAQRWLPSG